MSRELYIWIAFCVFAFLLGIQLKKRFGNRREKEEKKQVYKNQRPKMAREENARSAGGGWNREKTLRVFMYLLLVVLFGMMVYMLPALVRDVMRFADVDFTNLFLRVLILAFAILVFVTGYLKLVRQRKSREEEKRKAKR